MDSTTVGRIILVVGLLTAALGGYLALGGKLPFGSLPGDFSWSSGNVSVSVPLMSGIVISILLTVVINIFLRR